MGDEVEVVQETFAECARSRHLAADNDIYMPYFSNALSDTALKTLCEHTSKTDIPVSTRKVCQLGANVRFFDVATQYDAPRFLKLHPPISFTFV